MNVQEGLLFNLPSRTPTSFIYFAAAGVAAYFSDELEPLRWLAYSAAMMFVVRGPLQYFFDFIAAFEEDVGRDLRTMLHVVLVIVLIAQWVCYAVVGYWVYKFALAL